MKRLLLYLIGLYQRFISPAFGRRCKYHPTCSDYAVEAVRELGPLRGSILAAWRVLRCNPFSDGGIDDVADRGIFRDHAHRPRSKGTSPTPGTPAGAAEEVAG